MLQQAVYVQGGAERKDAGGHDLAAAAPPLAAVMCSATARQLPMPAPTTRPLAPASCPTSPKPAAWLTVSWRARRCRGAAASINTLLLARTRVAAGGGASGPPGSRWAGRAGGREANPVQAVAGCTGCSALAVLHGQRSACASRH